MSAAPPWAPFLHQELLHTLSVGGAESSGTQLGGPSLPWHRAAQRHCAQPQGPNSQLPCVLPDGGVGPAPPFPARLGALAVSPPSAVLCCECTSSRSTFSSPESSDGQALRITLGSAHRHAPGCCHTSCACPGPAVRGRGGIWNEKSLGLMHWPGTGRPSCLQEQECVQLSCCWEQGSSCAEGGES